MDVERKLLSRALMDRDIKPLLEAKIQPEYFQDAQNASLWVWMLDYFERYGHTPSAEALRQHASGWFEVVKAPDSIDFYIEQLMLAREYAVLHDAVAEAGLHLKNQDSGAARLVLTEGLGQLSMELSPMRDINLSDPGYIKQWIEEYDELKSFGGALRGLPTGFTTIDRASGGLRSEQLITVVGLPKAGKSTALLLMFKAVHDMGLSPLFIGFEMSNEEQRTRYAAIRAGVDFHRLDRGTLRPEEERLFHRALRELENTPDMWLSADPSATSTISGILAKIDTYHPACVFIDGVYMMIDEQTGEQNTPQALTHITRSLKRAAQRHKIPIICTTQVLAWKMSRKKGITSDAIGYTSSFAQDSDVILGLESTEEETRKRLRIVDARNMRNRVVELEWNWTTLQFEELDSYDPEDEEAAAS